MVASSKLNDTKEMTCESRLKWLENALRARLAERSLRWYLSAAEELSAGVDAARFCALFSMASRHARAVALDLHPAELVAAQALLLGWNPERWNLRMLLRAGLLLALSDLDQPAGELAIEEAFRYADEGEACALYASLCLLPKPERFVERATEGCRTNMLSVFEANVCDTPFPVIHFDDVAWNQCLIKCIFLGSPLWRVYGLDQRLSVELARIALDLVEERRSAGRAIAPDLWLCLGEHGGARGLAAMRAELEQGLPIGRAAAGYGLARAKQSAILEAYCATEEDQRVVSHFRRALDGACDQSLFGELNFVEVHDGEA